MKAPDSQIAVTLYNLRDYCQTESDLDRTLDKVCAIGYQAVQVSGTPLAADVIRKQLDKHNLFCCSGSDFHGVTSSEVGIGENVFPEKEVGATLELFEQKGILYRVFFKTESNKQAINP